MNWMFYLLITLCILHSTICASLPYVYPVQKSPSRTSKLSLADSAEWIEYYVTEPEGPGTYAFGYDVEDSHTGNVQFRTEERHANGTVRGSYGFVTPEGSIHIVHYVADHLGYRTKVENGKFAKLPNKIHKSVQESDNPNMSPQMLSALQSLGNNYNQFQKIDQYSRPANNIKSSSNIANLLSSPNRGNIIYEAHHIPSYQNNNLSRKY